RYRGWIRVALINPGHSTFVYKGIRAGRTYRFRLRAFDAAGVSEPSNEVRVTTTSIMRPPSMQEPNALRPCQPIPKVGTRVPSGEERVARVRRVEGGGHRFVVLTLPDSIGSSSDDPVALWADGCFRPVGEINNAFLSLGRDFSLGDDRGGWPVLLESSHA